jgi:uncharacterized membrane protein YeaQ/YmgE (transglycosylase-associated protein family)
MPESNPLASVLPFVLNAAAFRPHQRRSKFPGGMTMWLLWTIIIGILAGWLAGLIVKGRGMGVLVDLIVGIVGALIGGFVAGLIGLAAYGLIGRLAIATLGAVLLLLLVRVIKRA